MESSWRGAMTLEKFTLSTKKQKVMTEGGQVVEVEVPHLQAVFTITDEVAARTAAVFAAFQGLEVTIEASGHGRQLTL